MKERTATLTAKTKGGKEFSVVVTTENGYYKGAIEGHRATLTRQAGHFCVALSRGVVFSLMGVKVAQETSFIKLTSSWQDVVGKWEDEDRKFVAPEPTGFTHREGCDAASTYRFEFPEQPEIMDAVKKERRASAGRLGDLIGKNYKELVAGLAYEKRAGDGSSYYSHVFGEAAARELYRRALKLQREIDAAKESKKIAAKRAIEEKYEEASRTDKAVLLYKGMDDCDGSVDDCSFDSIHVFAMPDGTERTERHHCH